MDLLYLRRCIYFNQFYKLNKENSYSISHHLLKHLNF